MSTATEDRGSLGDDDDAIAPSSATDSTLHLDERYVFDGSHSDFAQQFYRRYLAGDEASAITDTSNLADVLRYVTDEFGLAFADLPSLLQQAVVWDMGYVAAADLGYVKVYTKCGLRMSELALSLQAYRSPGCAEQNCSSPNGEAFHQSLYCSGYQMGNVSLCAATNGITPVHGPMWSDGGTDDMVPVSMMQKHEWTDAGIDYTIMAIHLSGDPNSYGKCVMPAMAIPCVAYDGSASDASAWCSPEHGELVPQWLELEKTGGISVTESSGWQKAALPVTITSLVLLVLVLASVFAFWWLTRKKQSETEDLLEQKRAILGGRGSDAFSMMDDIDFILEAPGRSFIEMGGTPADSKGWVAWGRMPGKPRTRQPKQSDDGEGGKDLDAMLLHGGDDDGSDADRMYLHEGSAHHRHLHQSLRSPSKATTAALTSIESGAAGSPRNTLMLSFTPQTASTDPVRSSTDSSDPNSGTNTSPLVQFQNDATMTKLRVPFVDVSLMRQLTTGAYGEVWVGRMRGELVAVKRLVRDRRRHIRELEVFAAEIQLMASFSHSNVLRLVAVSWNTLENLCLIMEYMEHGDLQRVLQLHTGRQVDGAKPQRSASASYDAEEFSWASHKARIGRDMACGLQYLHALEPTVVHRDLKSKNVLIGDDYEAKLSDFGVSRLRHGEETMTSGVGTAYWTAPEVLAGHKYSEKADVYSLGVVLAELDTGELPFFDARTADGDKMEAIHILSLVVSGELQPSFSPSCPPDVRTLALSCLNPEPERRPTAAEVVRELNRLLASDRESTTSGGFMASSGYDVDFAALGLTQQRFEAFKSVFAALDKANTGAVTTKQLDALCFQLGERFDDEELAAATTSLTDPQTGLVHFHAFLAWWTQE
ncbi:hypothetical protein BBJ28_00004316 [Nothophytophthora sp. Chile5]|nr:hypothetical protein BBJ28_00004316 [Nothophytophthora sp. Chile5]